MLDSDSGGQGDFKKGFIACRFSFLCFYTDWADEHGRGEQSRACLFPLWLFFSFVMEKALFVCSSLWEHGG